jgi:hypothetical protein
MRTYHDLPEWGDGYNLESMSERELALVAKFLDSPSVVITQHMWPRGDAPANPHVGLRKLATIASLLHAARGYRLSGNIAAAVRYEREADKFYASLPD